MADKIQSSKNKLIERHAKHVKIINCLIVKKNICTVQYTVALVMRYSYSMSIEHKYKV